MGVDGGVVCTLGEDTLGDDERKLGSGPKILGYDDVCVMMNQRVLIWRDGGPL